MPFNSRGTVTLGQVTSRNVILKLNYESLLNKIIWNVSYATCLQLGIEFYLSRWWLKVLLNIAIYVHLFILNLESFIKHIKYIKSLWDLPSREVEYMTRLSPHTLESSNAPSWQAKENSSGQCWQAKWVYKPKQSLD